MTGKMGNIKERYYEVTEGIKQWNSAAKVLHTQLVTLVRDRLSILGMDSVCISMIIPERQYSPANAGDLIEIMMVRRLFVEDNKVYVEYGSEDNSETDIISIEELNIPEIMEIATQIISGQVKQHSTHLENNEDPYNE